MFDLGFMDVQCKGACLSALAILRDCRPQALASSFLRLHYQSHNLGLFLYLEELLPILKLSYFSQILKSNIQKAYYIIKVLLFFI